jgi:hypothetical protein
VELQGENLVAEEKKKRQTSMQGGKLDQLDTYDVY